MHVVFVHGLWCKGSIWDGWAERFRQAGVETHQPTLPCHDPSDAAAVARLSLADYCAFLADYIAALPEKPVLVGHSNGGLLSQKLTAMGLSRATLLLCAAGPRGVWAVWPRMLPHALPHFLKWGFWSKPITLSRWQAMHLLFNRLDPAAAEAALGALLPESGRVATEIVYSPLVRSLSLRVDAADIAVPMRSVVAVDDHIVPPAVGRALKRKYGERLEHVEIAGRGHWLPWEEGWQALADESLAWLTTHAAAD